MKMIGNLIDHTSMPEIQCSFSDLREIALQCIPSEETAQNNDKKEDENDVEEYSLIMCRRNKRSGIRCDSDEVENVRSTHEFLESNVEENDECEEEDDRDQQEKFLQLRKTQERIEDYAIEIEENI